MTLGSLIQALKTCNPEAEVRFDFGEMRPAVLESWRGSYDQLAMGYSEHVGRPTVGGVVALCESAVGASFTGYKGGEFVMSEDTPMWVSNYGDWSHTALTGVINEGTEVILETRYQPS